MARLKRTVRAGEPVHATARGVNRTPIFRHGFDKRKYLKRFALVAEEEGVEVHGYCILDNHVHFLLVPQTINGLARLFQRVHTWWAQYSNKARHRVGHLFQSRFFSCLVDSQHYFSAMRYIDLNPKAARIVRDPEKFEFSSARAHLTGRPDQFFALMMAAWRHRFSNDPEQYREFLQESPREEWKRIEQGLRSGLPVGSDDWIAGLEQEIHRRLRPSPPGRPRLATLCA